jgi:gamma-tubulin complex component 3
MAPNSNKLVDAVDRLITHIVPTNPKEDEETAQERHDNCFELVKNILERYGHSISLPDVYTLC